MNQPLSSTAFAAFQEGVIELVETAEEAVLVKRARVVEEIVVKKDTSEHTQIIRENVRHTEIEVERFMRETTSRTKE